MPTTYTLQEKMDQRQVTQTATGRKYVRAYHVITSARVTDNDIRNWLMVTASTPAPAPFTIGENHPDDSTAKLTTIDISDQAENGMVWAVSITWETPTLSGSISDDPLSRPRQISWAQEGETEEFARDFSSTPLFIQNSAGDPFDNNPSRERGYLTCTYVRNETTSHFLTVILPLMAYDYVVNSASFTLGTATIPALYARLSIKDAEEITEGATTYYRVTYFFAFRQGRQGYTSDGWRERYLDRGFYENISGVKTAIYDADGQIVEKPYPLDGSGGAAALPTTAPAILGPFKLYPEVLFSTLSFT